MNNMEIIQGTFPDPRVESARYDVREAWFLLRETQGGNFPEGVESLSPYHEARHPKDERILIDWNKIPKVLDFRKSVQWYNDLPEYAHPRLCCAAGTCVTCGQRTFEFADKYDDPRGALGDRSWSGITCTDLKEFAFVSKENQKNFPRVHQCALCAAEEHNYDIAIKTARKLFSRYARRFNIELGVKEHA